MKAAWFIHSKTLRRDMRFWLAITGYDLNDRSSSNRIYLLYVVVFFSLWGLTVLSMITSGVAQFLTSISPAHPYELAVMVAGGALLAWWLWSLYQVARRCPINFTPDDALLICATPVSRPAVVFTWLLGQWFTSALPFWGLAIMLGFIRAELSLAGKVTWGDTPLYLRHGMAFLLPVLGVQIGMLTLAWALACFRLQGSREVRYLVWLPVALGLLLAPGLILPGAGLLQLLSFPILLPVTAGAGLSGYITGCVVALVWAVAGLVSLTSASRGLNLDRAVQERTASPGVGLAGGQQAAVARLKRRLKSGSAPTRIPSGRGPWALVWKQAIRFTRAFSLGTLGNWLLLFAISCGVWMAPDWSSRSVALLFWASRVHALASDELRTDLGLWFPAQPLPLCTNVRLTAEVGPSTVFVVLVGWLAAATASAIGLRALPLELALLLPLIAANLALSSGMDVLRQTRVEHLVIGSVPSSGILALFVSGLVIAASTGLFAFFRGGPLALLLALVFSGLTAYGLLMIAVDNYQNLGE